MSEYILNIPEYTPPFDPAVREASLGEEIVRCKDCKHSFKDGALCNLFASWIPVAGGDEYAELPADVEPNGFCAWGERSDA